MGRTHGLNKYVVMICDRIYFGYSARLILGKSIEI